MVGRIGQIGQIVPVEAVQAAMSNIVLQNFPALNVVPTFTKRQLQLGEFRSQQR